MKPTWNKLAGQNTGGTNPIELVFRENAKAFPRVNRMALAAPWTAASAIHRVSAADAHVALADGFCLFRSRKGLSVLFQ